MRGGGGGEARHFQMTYDFVWIGVLFTSAYFEHFFATKLCLQLRNHIAFTLTTLTNTETMKLCNPKTIFNKFWPTFLYF